MLRKRELEKRLNEVEAVFGINWEIDIFNQCIFLYKEQSSIEIPKYLQRLISYWVKTSELAYFRVHFGVGEYYPYHIQVTETVATMLEEQSKRSGEHVNDILEKLLENAVNRKGERK